MKALLIAIMLCISFIGYSQVSSPPPTKTLIAHRTWIVASGAKSFRIITTDSGMAHKLLSTFEFKGIFKFSYVEKTNAEEGYKYWERTYYFKNEMWNEVVDTVNSFKKR